MISNSNRRFSRVEKAIHVVAVVAVVWMWVVAIRAWIDCPNQQLPSRQPVQQTIIADVKSEGR